jgi:hypothetical protein
VKPQKRDLRMGARGVFSTREGRAGLKGGVSTASWTALPITPALPISSASTISRDLRALWRHLVETGDATSIDLLHLLARLATLDLLHSTCYTRLATLDLLHLTCYTCCTATLAAETCITYYRDMHHLRQTLVHHLHHLEPHERTLTSGALK